MTLSWPTRTTVSLACCASTIRSVLDAVAKGSDEWALVERPFPAWGFKVAVAYRPQEVAAAGRQAALPVLLGGLVMTAALLAAAIWLNIATALGAPVSTTHVVATSIMGIGASERPRAVRWAKAKDISTTWVITIPGAAIVAIQAYALVHLFLGATP